MLLWNKMYELLQKLKWIDFLLILGIAFIAVGIGISYRENESQKTEIQINKKNVVATPSVDVKVDKKIVIDISGAVVNPGVYELKQGDRIDSALAAAGGLSAKADREWINKNINKAQILSDGQKIYIPKLGENNNTLPTAKNTNSNASGFISVNSADISELDKLSGIGEGLAARIIDYRQKNGGFKSIDELKLVPGIGEKLFEKIKDKISL
jgi:competence protein ComEA